MKKLGFLKDKKVEKVFAEPKFKEKVIGLDFIQSRPTAKERIGLIGELQLMSVVMTKPKMRYEDIIALPFETFIKYLLKYRAAYKGMYQKIAENSENPSKVKSGFQFVKEEDYTKEGTKGEIRFSKVS